jgi:hypothetical protein
MDLSSSELVGPLLPDAHTRLLFHAALGAPDVAREAWQNWERGFDWSGPIETATFRVLPLIYSHWRSFGGANELPDRVKGVYRFWWVRAQKREMTLRAALGALATADVPVMLIKGAPLALTVYPEPATRTMADVDLHVPLSRLPDALRALEGEGWTPREPEFLSHDLRHEVTLRHSSTRVRGEGIELDVQRYPLESCRWNDFNEQIWQRAATLEVANHEVKVPRAEDHLVLLAAHGLRGAQYQSFAWVTDLVFLLRAQNLDWNQVVALAQKTYLTAPVADALAFVREEFGAPVPTEILEELRASREPRLFQREYTAKIRPHDLRGALWLHAALYSRLRSAEKIGPRDYARRYWGLETPADAFRLWYRHRRRASRTVRGGE